MRSELVIRFDYGHIVPWVRNVDGTRLAVAGADALAFRTPADTRGEDMRTISEVVVEEGERIPFVAHVVPVAPAIRRRRSTRSARSPTRRASGASGTDCARARCRRSGATIVARSLMVLKALTYAPTGGIVAAPTTSLPEWIGSVRNWDYRYCWLRDATLTLLALLNAGHADEAAHWRRWLLRAVAGDPADLQIMYGVAGERRLSEFELPWLSGYEGSAPVRVGNAASEQLQIDVYGEVMDALYQARMHGLPVERARMGAAEGPARVSRGGVAEAGRGHLGDPRRAAALRALEGDGVGGVRPRRPHRRDAGARRPRRPLARAARRDPRRGVRPGLRREARVVHAVVRLAGAGREPARAAARRLPARLGPAHPRHGRGGRAGAGAGRSRPALPQRAPASTACRPARACSCRARSGSSTASSCSAATTTRTSCSGGCSRWRTTSGCCRRSTTRRRGRLLGNFPQAFTHLALVNSVFNVAPHLPSPMLRRHAHDGD